MSCLTAPRYITTPVIRMLPDTMRELELTGIRYTTRPLTRAEEFELDCITRRQNARAYAADMLNDCLNESHAFPTNPNLHDD